MNTQEIAQAITAAFWIIGMMFTRSQLARPYKGIQRATATDLTKGSGCDAVDEPSRVLPRRNSGKRP